jgi:hypothetical protein
MNKIKYCKFCDKEKPEEDFCKSGGYIKNICRDCQNKKQKEIYQDSKRTKQLEQEIERLNNIINELKWKPIEEYDKGNYDWVLVKYFDGDYECVPCVAEKRFGKWHSRDEKEIQFDVRYFMDMQQIDKLQELKGVDKE